MKFFTPVTDSYHRLRMRTHKDPARDWLTLLTLAAIAFICIVVWNIWAFDTVASGGTIGKTVTNAPAAFSPASMNAVRAVFQMRAAEEAKYVTGVYRYADPSQ